MTPAVILRLGVKTPADPDAITIFFDRRLICRGRDHVYLSQQAFAITSTIIIARGACVSRQDLISMLYDEREDGGPEYVDNAIYVRLAKARPALRRLGIDIRNHHGRGFYVHFLPFSSTVARAA